MVKQQNRLKKNLRKMLMPIVPRRKKRPKNRKIRTNCSYMLAQFKMKQLTEPTGQISLTRVSHHAEKY